MNTAPESVSGTGTFRESFETRLWTPSQVRGSSSSGKSVLFEGRSRRIPDSRLCDYVRTAHDVASTRQGIRRQ